MDSTMTRSSPITKVLFKNFVVLLTNFFLVFFHFDVLKLDVVTDFRISYDFLDKTVELDSTFTIAHQLPSGVF